LYRFQHFLLHPARLCSFILSNKVGVDMVILHSAYSS